LVTLTRSRSVSHKATASLFVSVKEKQMGNIKMDLEEISRNYINRFTAA